MLEKLLRRKKDKEKDEERILRSKITKRMIKLNRELWEAFQECCVEMGLDPFVALAKLMYMFLASQDKLQLYYIRIPRSLDGIQALKASLQELRELKDVMREIKTMFADEESSSGDFVDEFLKGFLMRAVTSPPQSTTPRNNILNRTIEESEEVIYIE